MIKILIADDTAIARDGLKMIINNEEDLEVVGECINPVDVLDKVETNKNDIDVILMDLKWFGDESAGWSLIKQIKSKYPEIRIIAMTAFESLIKESRRAGADLAITKNFSREDIIQYIRTIIKVENPYKDGFLQMKDLLTAREHEVLILFKDGYSYKDIANKLFISESTVKNHVRNIYEKLNVNNKIQALIEAEKQGLI